MAVWARGSEAIGSRRRSIPRFSVCSRTKSMNHHGMFFLSNAALMSSITLSPLNPLPSFISFHTAYVRGSLAKFRGSSMPYFGRKSSLLELRNFVPGGKPTDVATNWEASIPVRSAPTL